MNIAFWDLECSSLNASFGQLLCGVIGYHNTETPAEPHLKTFLLRSFAKERWNDTSLALAIRDELEKVDLAIGWNSISFDLNFLNTRLIQEAQRMAVLKRHKDLLFTARHKFRFAGNSLERVEQYLFGTSQKTKLSPKTWSKAVGGHRASYDEIVDHCQKDVIVLARIWDRIKDVAGVLK